VWLKVDAIEHKLTTKIKGIFRAKQTCLKGKEHLVKYKGFHHEAILMNPIHLNHLPRMVNEFE
jgi:hypothetical protein